jgi:hypothetical protein
VLRILSQTKDLVDRIIGNLSHSGLEIGVLENLDLLQHGKGSIVEVSLRGELGIS